MKALIIIQLVKYQLNIQQDEQILIAVIRFNKAPYEYRRPDAMTFVNRCSIKDDQSRQLKYALLFNTPKAMSLLSQFCELPSCTFPRDYEDPTTSLFSKASRVKNSGA